MSDTASDAQQPRPLVAVTGASGGIGRTLLPELLKKYRVRALYREGSGGRPPDGVEVVRGSLSDAASLDALVQGAHAVIHSAASVMRELSSAHATNVEGSVRLAECAARAGCKRLVHISTIAVYLGNKGHDGVFTEDLPLVENWRQDAYSKTKLRAEIALRECVKSAPMDLVIVRPTCVYGPDIEAWTKMPLQMFKRGLPLMLGRGQGELDAVHARDVVQALMLCVQHPAAAGQIFNLGDVSISTREFLGYFARMVGRSLRSIPRPVVKLILNGGGAMERHVGSKFMANISPNRLRLVEFCTSGVAGRPKFPSSKLRGMLGYQPAVSLTEGMLETHEWAVQKGLAPRRRFRNEEGMYAFTPSFTALPECETDVQLVVRRAAQQGKKLRVVGSLHSFCPLPATDEMCIAQQRMRKLVRVDGDRVTVQPGMKLSELNEALAQHGLALPALGAVTLQTVAGAVATGTHGGSLRNGSLADCVEAVRMVTASGEVLALDRSDERFFGAVLSLGLCGVTTELTLKCVPAFYLRSSVQVLSYQDLLAQLPSLVRNNEFCDINWYPLVERAEVMTCQRVDAPVANREFRRGHAPGSKRWSRWIIKRGVRKFHTGSWTPLHRITVNRWPGTWYPTREGRSDYVLAYQRYTPSNMPMSDFDTAVRVDEAGAAMQALYAHFVEHGHYPVLGMRVRPMRAEKFWLSGAYERDSCWIEVFHEFPAENYARRIHTVLEPFGARPHWGKTVHPAPEYWAKAYPKWDAFHALRKQCDPNGMFVNEYLERIGFVR